MTTVAVVGLGAMGSRIARRFLDGGHDVVVWNRDPGKAAPLEELGAAVAPTPAAAASRADVVVTVVTDEHALREVTEGQAGIASGASTDTTVVQMSTVGPPAISRLASVLPDGTGLLDAPVLGSLSEAESGTLRVFAGGPSAFVERWTPLLSVLGTVLHVGPLGAGTAAKLVANTTLVGVMGVLGEALALGGALGLTREATFAVLAATPLAAQAERRRPSVESGEYPPRFKLSLARKDAALIMEAATGAGIELRVVPAAQTWLAEAEAAGWGERDYSSVLAWMLGPR
jgi:3-hydroxyisobutyrate dehydrogenase-like beta-hydroxyacid dehydrogenase